MQPLRPATKAGIVAGGLIAAFAVAVLMVIIRQRLTDGPDAQASSGMHAFGDLLLGLAVFGGLTLAPLALAFYWLRPVARFWTLLAGAAVLFALTGPLALLVSWSPKTAGSWSLLGLARIGLMPFNTLALLAGALFAPQPKPRWILLGVALAEGGLFVGIVFVKFILSPL